MSNTVKDQCHTFFYGHHELTAAEEFYAMAEWCQQNNIKHDIYGEGELIQQFEQRVADLLGFEKGLFIATGTLNQPTVLQLVCRQKNFDCVAMHHTAHILKHECQGYQLQNRFKVLPIGDPFSVWTIEDLKDIKDDIAAALYELPMREIGGQLPTWEALTAIKTYCHQHNIHLHMDGARLWETKDYYAKEYAEIAHGFNSVYISLYKGIGGLGGSILVGSEALIERASVWVKRQGGNLARRSPYIVSAAMKFDQQLQKMSAYYLRTKEIYQVLANYPFIIPNPEYPQTSMLHLYLPISCNQATQVRDKIAKEHGIYFFNRIQSSPFANQCFFEWDVGDCLLDMPDKQLIKSLDLLAKEIKSL
ncbi:threonine aldolase [Endozoicomonas sp. SM1973]|uniref:Threonine aldolase n=1 Tax=Spartinivicinus marinus TaxID=2994442 RepID=A0A853IGT0_9GAMM|nr:beta-eliminating lyase-related protein [Spartinivicinus marinus]MCX4027362.1 beta-eliminating lyase-related protein [Spartinivicinus marinus]NYZ69211.1 threonine aldolase [Spartinivicinus marinus]